jgi:hypothetical protein
MVLNRRLAWLPAQQNNRSELFSNYEDSIGGDRISAVTARSSLSNGGPASSDRTP